MVESMTCVCGSPPLFVGHYLTGDLIHYGISGILSH